MLQHSINRQLQAEVSPQSLSPSQALLIPLFLSLSLFLSFSLSLELPLRTRFEEALITCASFEVGHSVSCFTLLMISLIRTGVPGVADGGARGRGDPFYYAL